jgi:hypothetical protein
MKPESILQISPFYAEINKQMKEEILFTSDLTGIHKVKQAFMETPYTA